MKKLIPTLGLALMLSGCAGLSINADFYGSYRSDVPMGGRGSPPPVIYQLAPEKPVNPGLKL